MIIIITKAERERKIRQCRLRIGGISRRAFAVVSPQAHAASRRVMTISSTYDHRIIQGAESGMFLRALDRLLQGGDGFYDGIAESLGIAAGTSKSQLFWARQAVRAALGSRQKGSPA